MRVLGVDYGRVRLGLALSDEDRILATALPTLERSRREGDDIARVARLVQEHAVGSLVVGLPLLLDGSRGTMANEASEFARQLTEKTSLPVYFVDERLTSSEAERAMLEGDLSRQHRQRLRDGVAAVLILQSYLDAQSSERGSPGSSS